MVRARSYLGDEPLSMVRRWTDYWSTGMTTVAVSKGLLAALEGNSPEAQLMSEEAERMQRGDPLIFFLIDGLGVHNPCLSVLSGPLGEEPEATVATVFPSTTASAVVSYFTGEWPGAHGIPGWWTYLPAEGITATVLPFVERFKGRSLSDLGIEVGEVYPVASRLREGERQISFFYPSSLSDSVFSGHCSAGAKIDPYGTVEDLAQLVIDSAGRLRRPTILFAYIPFFDAACHQFGVGSQEALECLVSIERMIERVLNSLGDEAAVAVSSDHGLVDVPREKRHHLSSTDRLLQFLKVPPTGEPRVPIFHVSGDSDSFEAVFCEQFGDGFSLIRTEDLIELGLLGSSVIPEFSRLRFGDYVGISRAEDILVYSERENATDNYIGYHGGLMDEEMLVPFYLWSGRG